MTENNDWINIIDRKPDRVDWYWIRTAQGSEFEAPLSINLKGELVWVLPDSIVITHWKNKQQ